jgi:hypothetical protein
LWFPPWNAQYWQVPICHEPCLPPWSQFGQGQGDSKIAKTICEL